MKLLYKIFIFSAFSIFASYTVNADNGYEIKVKLKNYTQDKLVLGFQLGDKSYIKDSAIVDQNGWFTFKNEKNLDPGVYIVLMKPDNQYFQILVDTDDQHFSFEADGKEPLTTFKAKNSKYNNIFYDYLRYIDGKRHEVEPLQKVVSGDNPESAKKKAQEGLDKINDDVRKYQDNLAAKNPNTVMALLVKASQDIEVPQFEGVSDSINKVKRYFYYKDHYFENIDLSNIKLLKTNVLFQKVDYYIQKLVVQHPDTVNLAVKRVLDKMAPTEEVFKFYLIHYLNFYAKSNIVGFDAVYVFIVENYYAKGMAPWTEKEQLDKITKEARSIKPTLIGKTAPNIKMYKQDNTPVSLYDVKSDFVVLLFWNPDCGHCKKEMPDVVAMEKRFKDKGVTVFSVCTALKDKVGECWNFIKDKEMQDFLNVVDPEVTSGYYTLYKVTQTPLTFILDKDKKIVSKKISPEQLDEVLEHFIEEKHKTDK